MTGDRLEQLLRGQRIRCLERNAKPPEGESRRVRHSKFEDQVGGAGGQKLGQVSVGLASQAESELVQRQRWNALPGGLVPVNEVERIGAGIHR